MQTPAPASDLAIAMIDGLIRKSWIELAILIASVVAPVSRAGAADGEFFEKRIRPILVEHCFSCHSTQAKKLKGGIRLDSRAALLRGGESGPAIVPGQPAKSRLIGAIGYQNEELRMPPRGKLPNGAIADLTTWVKMGAPWPGEENVPSAATAKKVFNLEQRKRDHWAWRPIQAPKPPAVRDPTWPAGPVDRFILARLENNGLSSALSADRRTLLRRVSFDLNGLPPTPAEIETFVHDRSPDAWEKVVDRLLASPHFGERWGRHWLDLVRYAETRGHEFDFILPNAYQYRDYVIRALNADVPYDQFAREHVAGDLLARPRLHPTELFNESILGTGFWFLGEEVHSPVDTRQDEADRLDNKIDVFSKAFLGLTVACARCHDHKFDAISTRDYYALLGFLESSNYRLARFDTLEHNWKVAQDLDRLRQRYRGPLQHAMAMAIRPGLERFTEYVTAARTVIAGHSLAQIARDGRLDKTTLEHWIKALADAEHNPASPLYPLALVTSTKDPRLPTDRLKPLLESWHQRELEAKAAVNGAQVVIDYGRASPTDWMPDGVSFGTAPMQPGDVRFSGDSSRPIAEIVTTAAAIKDPIWDRLKLRLGTQTDPGALAGPVRSGRTLRTPSFTLTTGKVFYLVKGSARVYAAVDSHVMIDGPLHGRLVTSFKTGNDFQWVTHDLSPYRGHRTHIEFTALENSDLAVAMVVQAEQTPGAMQRPNHALWTALTDLRAVDDVAAPLQQLLLDVTDRMTQDRIRGSADAGDYAPLANWLVHHTELFVDHSHFAQELRPTLKPFEAERTRLLADIQAESRLALAIQDGNGFDERVFIRGSRKNLGERVPRRFLEALVGFKPLASARGSGRLELARQITDPAINPFITRVLVNRVWYHLFGRGIVASVDNFGVLGERPTHPELLDYLADRFARDGWSIKKLARTLVLSKTYRMSSHPVPKMDLADPENLWLHRTRLRRLEGEAIRDGLLATSGRLDPRMYGPPVPVHLNPFQEGRGRPASGPLDGAGRRSIYLSVHRNFLSAMLLAFDTPIPFSTVGCRTVSNVPAQALILMNDPFVHEQADVWARRVLSEPGSMRARIASMYVSAFGRLPTEEEYEACRGFLLKQSTVEPKHDEQPAFGEDPEAWKALAHALFNLKDFIYIH